MQGFSRLLLRNKGMETRSFLGQLFHQAVAAADPRRVIAENLPARPKGRTIVIGAGKASAHMAKAFEEAWDGPIEGIVVTRYGYAIPCSTIKVLEANHPLPDGAGLAAATSLKELLRSTTSDDLVVGLISGGGSALLPAPPDPFTLVDDFGLNDMLLRSGAPISAMNVVRKHFSTVKGGRLAALAYPAKVCTFVISDVPGDVASLVAGGPTVPDKATRFDALDIIRRYKLEVPAPIVSYLETPEAEAPRPDDKVFDRNSTTIIASAALSLDAAADFARERGIGVAVLSDAIEGESKDVARVHGAMAKSILRRDLPFSKPILLLSGGETTVTVKGSGRGGRNSEFALSLAIDIAGERGIYALAADTDGVDGSEDNAGAFVDGSSVERLLDRGLDPQIILGGNDAYTAFEAIDDLFVTGPTGTNVNDFRAILITGD